MCDLSVSEKIKREIRASIAQRRLLPGQRLPPVRALAREVGVSAGTVAKVFRELRLEGVVHGHRGKGVFVADSPPVASSLRVQWLPNMTQNEIATVSENFRKALPHCELKVETEGAELRALPLDLVPRFAKELQDIEALVMEYYGRTGRKQQAFDCLRVGGRLLLLPVTLASCAMFANVDLFEAEGIPLPSEDWNHETLLETARRLTRREKDQYGIVVCKDARPFLSFVWQHGGHLFDPLGTRCLLSEPEGIAAAKFLRELSRFSPPLAGSGSRMMSHGIQEFLKGNVAMAFAESWNCLPVATSAPFRFKALPFPGGRIRAPFLSGNGYAVSRDAELETPVRTFLRVVAEMEKWPDHVSGHGPIPLHADLEEDTEVSKVFMEARDRGRVALSDIDPPFRSEEHLRVLPVISATIKQIIYGEAPVETLLSHLRDIVNDLIASSSPMQQLRGAGGRLPAAG